MIPRALVLPFVLIVSLGVAGCNDPMTSPSPDEDLEAAWQGSLIDSVVGPGTMLLAILQSGDSLSGTWATTFQDPALNHSGPISGSRSGASVTLIATTTTTLSRPCPFTITATVSGLSMSGTYVAFNCSGAVTGSISLTKQPTL